jgi:hypothetical protein
MPDYTYVGDFDGEDFDAEDFWVSAELEDPVATLLRLITSRIRVVKDSGSVASILATEAAYDRELLKEYDAQITLALDPNVGVLDQKLELSGRLRRRYMGFKCSIHAVDKSAPGSDSARVMRNKVTAQIEAIIRENRNLPYQTVYNFSGLGYPSGDPHKAFAAGAVTDLAPSSTSWAELSVANYQKIWSSDDVRHSKSTTVSGEYALMLFRFKIQPREACVKKVVISFEGYGLSPNGNGVRMKLWNHESSVWEQEQWNIWGSDMTLIITLTSESVDYIDSNGYLYVLVKTRTASNGVDPAVLYCDFVECTVQVYGISHVDVITYRNTEVTDVKPHVFQTEFLLKGWLFETISGAF